MFNNNKGLSPAIILAVFFSLWYVGCIQENDESFNLDGSQLVISSAGKDYFFNPKFTILYRQDDPQLAMRRSGIEGVPYNVVTWTTHDGEKGDLKAIAKDISQEGDGFDPRILDGKVESRTPNYYKSGQLILHEATGAKEGADSVVFEFAAHELFTFQAVIKKNPGGYPLLTYTLKPKVAGYFSVGYSGAPAFDQSELEEIWQPLIWQEKRFPTSSYMTLAFRAPIPTTLVNDGVNTLGVLAHPEEFPFNPLPLANNSRFGVVLRDFNGAAKPQLFAPVLGGQESKMNPGDVFNFRSYLMVEAAEITETYEKVARETFGFKDFRKNEIASLNETFENIVEYSKSDYSRYIDSLKGFAYSTDVPGAVKNVSSLNPLELALVTDDPEIFDSRAYPMIEYMLSREKFLFSLDPEQKIQHPSRKMHGPIAPISELVSLYNIFHQSNDFLVDLAKDELKKSRIRNLDVAQSGENWINYMHLYKATNDQSYLDLSVEKAKEYIASRVETRQVDFKDPLSGGTFFWTGFTNRWIELTELYELTKDEAFLQAAVDGARHYTMYTWMSPAVPDEEILVNKGGKAPVYWYLKSKGHEQMYYPEENVPAWRLSEMGLTPESSGTSTGHRAIFMANYAPWLLRLGYYANDDFLMDVGKSAIIGRYRNFPGYHINTARTTAYEKADYPYHEHKELSVNSFHYNHIMPMASMLLDYLVTDVFVRSKGQVDFPSEYIEGYAYLQNKFYGAEKGSFYGVQDVQLWMPKDLVEVQNVELNYLTARKENKLYVAFTNQSDQKVISKVKLNPDWVSMNDSEARFWQNNELIAAIDLKDGIEVEVPANGIAALEIDVRYNNESFQQAILTKTEKLSNAYREIELGNARAMLFNFGDYGKRAFIYVRDDDSRWESWKLTYQNKDGDDVELRDQDYPFEFTVILKDESMLEFELTGNPINGKAVRTGVVKLGETIKRAM